MNYLILESYTVFCGVQMVVLSVIICIFRLILKRIIKDRISNVTRSYFEIGFAVLMEFIYVLVFTGDVKFFNIKAISCSLVSYSLSLVIYSIIARILKGKTLRVDARALIIEGIISPYVDEKNLTKIAKDIADATEKELDDDKLLPLIAENLIKPASDEEIIALIDIIRTSVKNTK